MRAHGRRRSGVLILLGTVLICGLLTGTATGASSWKTNHAVDFSAPKRPKGCEAYNGPYTGGKSFWSKDDVKISGGMLRLYLRERSVSGRSWTSGGLACLGWGQSYGRFEMRAKMPPGRGIDSYLGLSPTKAGTKNAW